MDTFAVTDDLANKVEVYAQKLLWSDLLHEFQDAVRDIGGVQVESRFDSSSPNEVQLDQIGARVVLARMKHLAPGFPKSQESLERDISDLFARKYAEVIIASLAEQGFYFSFKVFKSDVRSIASEAIDAYSKNSHDFLRGLI